MAARVVLSLYPDWKAKDLALIDAYSDKMPDDGSPWHEILENGAELEERLMLNR